MPKNRKNRSHDSDKKKASVSLPTHSNSVPAQGTKAWQNTSASLARVKGSPAAAPMPTVPVVNAESWPTLGQGCCPDKVAAPAVQHQQHVPQAQPEAQWSGLPAPAPVSVVREPQIPVLPLPAEKRKAEPWSQESSPRSATVSPGSSPPLSPAISDPKHGCRRVDGVMVSPEPVENPNTVLQRWISAGQPSMKVYALMVHDTEIRAFRRALEVALAGEAPNRLRSGAPMRKTQRRHVLIDPNTAMALLEELSRVDVGALSKMRQSGYHGHFLAAHCRGPNTAVRCFQFGTIIPNAPLGGLVAV